MGLFCGEQQRVLIISSLKTGRAELQFAVRKANVMQDVYAVRGSFIGSRCYNDKIRMSLTVSD